MVASSSFSLVRFSALSDRTQVVCARSRSVLSSIPAWFVGCIVTHLLARPRFQLLSYRLRYAAALVALDLDSPTARHSGEVLAKPIHRHVSYARVRSRAVERCWRFEDLLPLCVQVAAALLLTRILVFFFFCADAHSNTRTGRQKKARRDWTPVHTSTFSQRARNTVSGAPCDAAVSHLDLYSFKSQSFEHRLRPALSWRTLISLSLVASITPPPPPSPSKTLHRALRHLRFP